MADTNTTPDQQQVESQEQVQQVTDGLSEQAGQEHDHALDATGELSAGEPGQGDAEAVTQLGASAGVIPGQPEAPAEVPFGVNAFEIPDYLETHEIPAAQQRFLTLRYDPNHHVHRGGSGSVLRVHNADGEVFALKMLAELPASLQHDEETRLRTRQAQRDAFRREYENQLRLAAFDGFPELYGYGETASGEPFILMQWIEGITIAKARRRIALSAQTLQLPPVEVAQLGVRLFDLLTSMDVLEENFVHRDISPSNIMLCRDPGELEAQDWPIGDCPICLIDFGTSSAEAVAAGSFTVTTSIMRKATPDYAPPEMLTNDIPNIAELRKSHEIDVYAVCSVLYELLAGYTPYRLTRQGRIHSFYRFKKEHEIPFPLSVHAGGFTSESVQRERELFDLVDYLDQTTERAANGRGANNVLGATGFSWGYFRECVNVVDSQLGHILLQGLAFDQGERPSAQAMKDMLETFVENYYVNIARRYCGVRIRPFSDGSERSRTRATVRPQVLPQVSDDATIITPDGSMPDLPPAPYDYPAALVTGAGSSRGVIIEQDPYEPDPMSGPAVGTFHYQTQNPEVVQPEEWSGEYIEPEPRKEHHRVRNFFVSALACILVAGVAIGATWMLRESFAVFGNSSDFTVTFVFVVGLLVAPAIVSLPFFMIGKTADRRLFSGTLAVVLLSAIVAAALIMFTMTDSFVPFVMGIAQVLIVLIVYLSGKALLKA